MGIIVFFIIVVIVIAIFICVLIPFMVTKKSGLEDPKETKRKLLDELWSKGKLNDEVYKDYLKKL